MRAKLGIGALAAAVAFLVATNPVVVDAAGQVTSAQIKNDSIKGKDVKNGTIRGADVNESSLRGVDASTLRSLPPGSYLNRGGYSAGTASQSIPASVHTQVQGPVAIDLPVGVSSVSVIGQASYDGPQGLFFIWYAVDASCSTLSGPGWSRRVQTSITPDRANATVLGLEPLGTGTHTIRLCAFSTTEANLFNPQLLVQTVAGGATGS